MSNEARRRRQTRHVEDSRANCLFGLHQHFNHQIERHDDRRHKNYRQVSSKLRVAKNYAETFSESHDIHREAAAGHDHKKRHAIFQINVSVFGDGAVVNAVAARGYRGHCVVNRGKRTQAAQKITARAKNRQRHVNREESFGVVADSGHLSVFGRAGRFGFEDKHCAAPEL